MSKVCLETVHLRRQVFTDNYHSFAESKKAECCPADNNLKM